MRIIYAKMQGYDWVSTPSDAVARELEKAGHTIEICEDIYSVPVGDFDFVWSPYESATLLGDYISDYKGIPHFSHIGFVLNLCILTIKTSFLSADDRTRTYTESLHRGLNPKRLPNFATSALKLFLATCISDNG